MNILLVEDDEKIAGFIKAGLEDSGYQVAHTIDGEQGFQLAIDNKFDAAIVDVMLPSMNGYSVIEQLRSQKIDIPMLILSAKSSLDDKIKGLSLGADDYLTKPFALSELKARLEALLRRVSRSVAEVELVVADLKLDLSEQRVYRGKQEIILQPKEFMLLKFLVENQDQVVSKKMIIEKVWHYNFDPNTNIVEVRMCSLRDKIDKDFEHKLIETVRGIGYVLRG